MCNVCSFKMLFHGSSCAVNIYVYLNKLLFVIVIYIVFAYGNTLKSTKIVINCTFNLAITLERKSLFNFPIKTRLVNEELPYIFIAFQTD